MKKKGHIHNNLKRYKEINEYLKEKYDSSSEFYKQLLDEYIYSNNEFDIDEIKKHELYLESQVELDSLNELYNKMKIEDFINNQLVIKENNETKYAFILLDIDNFNKINKKYGRMFGNETLNKVELKLKSLVRDNDFISRVSGDEFIIFIKDIKNKNDVLIRAYEICKSINLIFFYDFPELHVSCSCGISIAKEHGNSFNELYNISYIALTEAKKLGKNCCKIYGEESIDINNKSFNENINNKILIVDDIDINREILKSIFSDEYEVLEAENGQVALDIIKEKGNEILAVILDIIMPIKNGFEVMAEMKNNNLINEIPVIVVTMIDETENEVKALEMGAVDLIVRPYNSKVIKERIRNVISRKELSKIKYQNKILKEQNETAERYRIIVEQTGAIVYEWNPIDRTFYSSAGIKEFLISTTKPYLVFSGKDTCCKYFHPEDYGIILNTYFRDILEGNGKTIVTVRLKKLDGSFVWCEITINCVKDDDNNIQRIIGTIADVDEKIKSEQKLLYMAKYDELTGIYDKDEFYRSTLDMIKKNNQLSYAVIVMNISKFKVLNDIFGLKAGDKLLCFIANYLKTNLVGDVRFGRLQADSFAMCVPADKKFIINLIKDIEKNISIYPLDFNIIVNFGIYLVDKYDECVNLMCDKANIALSTIKGNYVKRYEFYDSKMRRDLIKQQELINDVKLAMQNGEFNIHIQPQIEYKSGEIVSGEALVRWNHKTKGMIPPNVFINLFEENGFITKLDMHIWECTCKLIRKWIDNGQKVVPISVNVSRIDIFNLNLNDHFNKLIKKYNLPKGVLELEITETAYMENSVQLIEIVNKLRSDGFKVLIDDFGSGYSSLSMLKDIEVDILKLDRSFIQDANVNKRSEKILTAIVYMANALKVPIIAEGIETKEQAEFLGELGCDIIQGYYYSKPLPIDKFENLLNSQKLIGD